MIVRTIDTFLEIHIHPSLISYIHQQAIFII